MPDPLFKRNCFQKQNPKIQKTVGVGTGTIVGVGPGLGEGEALGLGEGEGEALGLGGGEALGLGEGEGLTPLAISRARLKISGEPQPVARS